MPATGLDTAASHPRRPVPGAGSGLPSLGMGTGRDTGPALFPAASPGLARLPPPPLPRRRAPGTGEEGGQQHQHQHRNRHVDEQSNGGGRGRSGADGPQRRQRSAGGGTGGRGGRWGWEEPGRRGRRDLGATGRGGPRGASTGAGRPRDIPERQGVKDPPRGAVAPVGLEAPGDVGRDVLSSSPAGLGRGQAPPGVEEGSGTSTPGAGGTWG